MSRRLLACALLLALPLATYGEDKAAKRPPAPANPAFEKMKSMAGTWLIADENGKPTDEVMSIIKVTSGGSAVHEVIAPVSPRKCCQSTRLTGRISC